jgi:hypothetical protein
MKKLFTLILLSAATSLTLSAQAASEYSAKYCEAFIDGLRLSRSSHALTRVEVRVKLHPERLDGAVKAVRLYVVRKTIWTQVTTPGYMADGAYEIDMVPFYGASDYYTTPDTLTLGHDWGAWEYQVTPYVETDKGTRYFANAKDGGNFTLNFDTAHALENIQSDTYSSDSPAVSTLNEGLRKYNPQACR